MFNCFTLPNFFISERNKYKNLEENLNEKRNENIRLENEKRKTEKKNKWQTGIGIRIEMKIGFDKLIDVKTTFPLSTYTVSNTPNTEHRTHIVCNVK